MKIRYLRKSYIVKNYGTPRVWNTLSVALKDAMALRHANDSYDRKHM